MSEKNITLTPADRLILESYKTVMDGLAEYLGSGYEFVLHSLEDYEHSVIRILNGHHTGRKVGAPITDMALAMLSRINDSKGAQFITYAAKNKHGAPLKATTIVIRGEKNRIIALLCINFYLNTPLTEIISSWTAPEANDDNRNAESFVENSNELLGKLITDAVARVETNPSIHSASRMKTTIELLDKSGVFKLKGAVACVAKRLGISKNTVYLHLRNMKGTA